MDTFSSFEWNIPTGPPWSTLSMAYTPIPQNQSIYASDALAQASKVQELSMGYDEDNTTSDTGTAEDEDSADDASICSDQCSQVSCSDCCSETVCQPCENSDTCEVPAACPKIACADSTCLVELPVCLNDNCRPPSPAASWQAWQESILIGSAEFYDHSMLSTPGGFETYPSTLVDCYRIIQGLHLQISGFCPQSRIYRAVVDHLWTYHGELITQYFNAHPGLLPTPDVCYTSVDHGFPSIFAAELTPPALSILSCSMGSEYAAPALFTSELRHKGCTSSPAGASSAGSLTSSGLCLTPIQFAASPAKRRKVANLTDSDIWNRGETISTEPNPSRRSSFHDDDTARCKWADSGQTCDTSIPTCDAVDNHGFKAQDQHTLELHPQVQRSHEQRTHTPHTPEQQTPEQRSLKQQTPKQRTHEHHTSEQRTYEQHACRWVLDHISDLTCGATFDSASILQDHVEKAHVNELTTAEGLKCQWQHCKRNNDPFKQKMKLKRHVCSHTGHKGASCPLCSQCFTTETLFKQHMRVHTGEKPYPCTICHKRFAHSTALTSHIRTHTGEKPLICGVNGCQKAFSESSNLSKHRKSHNAVGEYVCEMCNKDFNRKDGLRRHMKTHNKKQATSATDSEQ